METSDLQNISDYSEERIYFPEDKWDYLNWLEEQRLIELDYGLSF